MRDFSNSSGPGVYHIIFWASTILSFKILKRGERELTGGKVGPSWGQAFSTQTMMMISAKLACLLSNTIILKNEFA